MFASTRRLLGASLLATAALISACSDDDDDDTGTGPVVTVPAAPAGTAPVGTATATSVQISWSAVSGATSYVIQRATGAAGTFANAGTSTTTSFTDNGLTANTAYRYRVAAANSAGQGAFGSEITVTTATEGTAGPQRVDVTANITANTTWTSNNVYVLKGFIQVANGATLTIQAGTRIEGDFATLGASLFVLRGARIEANGTAAAPIVFTSSRAAGQRQPGDWGGLIVVGNARVNRAAPVILEGTGGQSGAAAVDYAGGINDLDNSGTLRYVRVEFAGFATAPDAELNSFTFAAVGSGTTVEFLQAMSGLDDHYEWFGGQMDAKNLVSYEAGDDHFDMSEGYQGRLQNLIALQTRILTPRPQAGNVSSDPQGIENDGCNGSSCLNGEESTPFTIPLVSNFTLVGTGPGVVPSSSAGIGMVLRRGTAGFYVNGHLSRWPNGGIALRNTSASSVAQANRIADGTLLLRNILVTDGAAIFETGSNRLTVDTAANALQLNAATTAAAFVAFAATPTSAASLDWAPAASAPQRTGGLVTLPGLIGQKAGSFISGTTYRGAADPNGPKWWAGWTIYAAN
jgi:hypothetical protein